ncbi:hypothetical protein CS022_08665 [Veronia nyctiphanis]|uniref:Major facilitator superfamily (MFS) profile domain-containing protein n=1 Tax=Veronia nyctiphanis TaxID=1278244 RepID=A0A4Q0YQY4_9GAMM|nr:MFS transporter [Veronia nyctiphanis]RXJ73567.1 hypothetical protein CS022_08665 [Veronia nyctiphanis]
MSCYLLAGCEILVLYTVVLHLPFLLVSENQISASETGFILSLFLLMMSLVSMFYGKVSGKLSIPAIHLLGWFAIGTGLVLLGLGQSLSVLVLSLVLAGVGLGLIRPNLIIWLFSFTPLPQRGKVIGGITTCFFVGQFASPLITEPVVQFFGKESGYSMLFLLMGSVALGVTFILAIRYLLTQKSSETADNL